MSSPVLYAFIEVGVTHNWTVTYLPPGFVWPGNVLLVPHVGAVSDKIQLTYSQGPVGVSTNWDAQGHIQAFYTFAVTVTNTGSVATPYALEVSTS
jgi:hypothetical protein